MIRDTQTKNKDKGKVEVNPINDTEGGSQTKHNRQERNDYVKANFNKITQIRIQ